MGRQRAPVLPGRRPGSDLAWGPRTRLGAGHRLAGAAAFLFLVAVLALAAFLKTKEGAGLAGPAAAGALLASAAGQQVRQLGSESATGAAEASLASAPKLNATKAGAGRKRPSPRPVEPLLTEPLLTPEDYAADRARLRQLLAAWPAGKPRGALLALARNGEAAALAASMAELEARSNALPGRRYPWLFLNDQSFTRQFREVTGNATAAPCFYGRIPAAHWGYPPWINQTRAAERRREMAAAGSPYGGSESYRFMCRWFSGFFAEHELLAGLDYYWRVEPNVSFTCTLEADPFRRMEARNLSYGFNVMHFEAMDTVPTLWATVKNWSLAHPGMVAPNNAMPGLLAGAGGDAFWHGCHWWSNFEIGRLSFFRSGRYRSLFEHLDRAGGFFYERWGDASVHTLAAGALLDRSRIHFFNDVGYRHGGLEHCPRQERYRQRCECDPDADVHKQLWGCLLPFTRVLGLRYEVSD